MGEATAATVEVFGPHGAHFASIDQLVSRLQSEGAAGDTVLVKGSRFMRMERVVAALVGDAEAEAH